MPLREQAAKGLRRAVEFFRKEVSVQGGYLWRYSEDLARREGEAKATATQAWVQPPGTPSVGMAYLTAYQQIGDAYYLEAARETVRALVMGQLISGGWDYRIEFDVKKRPEYAYRMSGTSQTIAAADGKNVSTLDDDTTQAALRLLIQVDKALDYKDKDIHEAAGYALDQLLKAQYPNGAWPQRFERSPDPAKFPVKKANYPESWPRTWPGSDYRAYYTFNDNNIADMVDTLLLAERTYGGGKYRDAVQKAGDFMLLAQMPDPQPAWAQQYNIDMQPAWARKFEPPSVTGGESFGVMRTLMTIYRETGEKKYLEPIPRALDYFRRSLLPDGRLARFYELQTNKPLYFTTDYKLVYTDDDLPTHYGFKVGQRIDVVAREYERVGKADLAELNKPRPKEQPRVSPAMEAQVKAVLAALDSKGRWVEDGTLRYHGPDDPTRRVLSTQTFIRNVGVLSNYLAAK